MARTTSTKKDTNVSDKSTNDQSQDVSNDDVKATGDADKAENQQDTSTQEATNTGSDNDLEATQPAGGDDEESKGDEGTVSDPASDEVKAQIEEERQAVEDHPEAPEEAIETKYIAGGEVPVGAPGTEGLPRE